MRRSTTGTACSPPWNFAHLNQLLLRSDTFGNQVLTYRFPGYPSPPLGLLFKLATTMEMWLQSDPANVVVIHCMNGKGRSLAVAAVLRAWMGESATPLLALDEACEARGGSLDTLTIPSQRRYMGYFASILQGVKPRVSALVMTKVRLVGVPVFGRVPSAADAEAAPVEGCRAYLQVFKGGNMLHSSAGSDAEPAWSAAGEGSVIEFDLSLPVQGDLLIRCRHIGDSGVRVSMFRAAFHTGYVSNGLLRFSKSQLDMAADDPRFPVGSHVEVHFAQGVAPQADTGEAAGVQVGPFDAMLEAVDSSWGDIAARRVAAERAQQRAAQEAAAAAAVATAQATAAQSDQDALPRSARIVPTEAAPAFGLEQSGSGGDSSSSSMVEQAGSAASADGSSQAATGSSALNRSTQAEDDALLAEIDELEALEAELGLGNEGSSSLRRGGSGEQEGGTDAPDDVDISEIDDLLEGLDDE